MFGPEIVQKNNYIHICTCKKMCDKEKRLYLYYTLLEQNEKHYM